MKPVGVVSVFTLPDGTVVRALSGIEHLADGTELYAAPVSAVTEELKPSENADMWRMHARAFDAFLKELYAIMVDPCAEGEIKRDDCMKAIQAAALRDREAAAFKLCNDCQQSSDCLHFARCFRVLASSKPVSPVEAFYCAGDGCKTQCPGCKWADEAKEEALPSPRAT